MTTRRRFRGWPLVGVGFLVYGLGMAPAYYSWGFFAPEVIDDLGLTREQIGDTFGLFTLTFALTSPLAALAIERFGLRVVVTAGSVLAALGFWLASHAGSARELTMAFALLGGVGIGLSALLPAQALPVFWFRRYRARATGVILLGAAVVGSFVPAVDDWILRHADWRAGWRTIAAVSLGVAALAATFLRTRPEEIGQRPDGDPVDSTDVPSGDGGGTASHDEPGGAPSVDTTGPDLDTSRALRTPQFLLLTFACLANAVPWRVFTAHGRLHFEDLGFGSTLAAAILGLRVGVSAMGRLAGSAGDFIAPGRVLALSLATTALGMSGLAFGTSTETAYVCVVLLGFGYGAGFTSEPMVFAHTFGVRAFVGSNGLRLAIVGVVGWLGPRWTGAAADASGSYTNAFLVLAALGLLGAVAVLLCRPPAAAQR